MLGRTASCWLAGIVPCTRVVVLVLLHRIIFGKLLPHQLQLLGQDLKAQQDVLLQHFVSPADVELGLTEYELELDFLALI